MTKNAEVSGFRIFTLLFSQIFDKLRGIKMSKHSKQAAFVVKKAFPRK